jgi:ABC-type branched-subunit amino acid transport system ATPase component
MSISGINKVSSGKIIFNKKNITNLPPYKIVGLGISQVPL